MKAIESRILRITAIVGITACLIDILALFVLGEFYPGFSQLRNTMSSLGASNSPVSFEMSLSWVVVGVLFVVFGIGLRRVFAEPDFYSKAASLLLILYGIGEGIGSGIFKADQIANGQTLSADIHDTVGGIGVAAVLILPFIMKRLISNDKFRGFAMFSNFVFIIGVVSISLFLFRFSSNENNFFSIYKGIWQRIFMLDIYVYLMAISLFILKQKRSATMKLIEVLKPKIKKRYLLFVAALVWTFAGGMLLAKGTFMFIQFPTFIWLKLPICIALGGVFYASLFSKISAKHVTRIMNITIEKPCLFSFFNFRSYGLMLLMISLGITLRKLGIVPMEYLSLLYITMGIPLFLSSLRFYYSGIYYHKTNH